MMIVVMKKKKTREKRIKSTANYFYDLSKLIAGGLVIGGLAVKERDLI